MTRRVEGGAGGHVALAALIELMKQMAFLRNGRCLDDAH